MKIYWSINSIPELAGLSPNEQNKVWRSCVWKCYKHWQTWVGLVLGAAIGGIGAIVAIWLIPDSVPVGLIERMLIIAPFGGIGGLILGQIAIHQTRPYLKAYVESRKMKFP